MEESREEVIDRIQEYINFMLEAINESSGKPSFNCFDSIIKF